MPEFLNVISIVCNISPHFVDSSIANETNQDVLRKHTQHLFNLAFKHINKTNRIAIASGNNAEISYTGPPEDAVLLATDIFDKISASNKHCTTTLSASIGIYLESISLLDNLSEHPKIIKNGINFAKQLMNLAKPNEILVSASFYETISPNDQSRTTLFEEVTLKHDSHVIDFEEYLLIPKSENAKESDLPELTKPILVQQKLNKENKPNFFNLNQLKYVMAVLVVVVLINASFELSTLPTTKPIKIVKPRQLVSNKISDPVKASFLKVHFVEPALTQQNVLVENFNTPSVKKISKISSQVKAKQKKKKTTKILSETIDTDLKKLEEKEVISEAIKNEEIIVTKPVKSNEILEQKMVCSQAAIALNQCH